MEIPEIHWAEQMNAAITVCDEQGVILYMNERARATYASHGDLIGSNLFDCHPEHAGALIREMLSTGRSNAYTISKQGQRKMIYQSPWRRDGRIAGMVEISMVIPEQMPHYIRKG